MMASSMTFDIRAEIARANADYFDTAAQVDARNHARKFAVALDKVLDDARRSAAFHKSLGYYGQTPPLLTIIAALAKAKEKV